MKTAGDQSLGYGGVPLLSDMSIQEKTQYNITVCVGTKNGKKQFGKVF